MNNYLDHPGEEVLERFVMNQSGEEELEVVETHIMACDSCVAKLEGLEIEIAATKLALQEMKRKEAALSQAAAARQASVKSWFALPRLAMAGAVAALAIGIAIAPQYLHRNGNAAMATLSLSTFRGQEMPAAPAAKPLHVVLNAADMNQQSLVVKLVDGQGKQEWQGTATVEQDKVAVNVPQIREPGKYLFQLYAPGATNPDQELREFSFEVK